MGTTSTTGSINADGKKYSIDSIQAEVVLENWRKSVGTTSTN